MCFAGYPDRKCINRETTTYLREPNEAELSGAHYLSGWECWQALSFKQNSTVQVSSLGTKLLFPSSVKTVNL